MCSLPGFELPHLAQAVSFATPDSNGASNFSIVVLTVEINGGGPKAKAIRKYRLVKKSGPNDLVFQSVKDGKPMRDNNILTRFIKPAAQAGYRFRELALPAHFQSNLDD
jgi:hypothetical protein